MANDPRKHVEAWLDKQGYPLEYRVARLLRAEGGERFRVDQGQHWQDADPRTGARKARELDVVTTLTGRKVITRVVIECKHLVDPWVIFEHEDPFRATTWEQTVDLWMASKPVRQLLSTWFSGGAPAILKAASGFKIVDTRFDRKAQPDETTAFDGAMQLARGAWALHQSTPKGINAITFPAMVLEGDLFSLSYDSRGRRRLAEANRKRLLWSAAVLEGPQEYIRPWPILIDVVTTAALEEWVDSVVHAAREIHDTIEEKL